MLLISSENIKTKPVYSKCNFFTLHKVKIDGKLNKKLISTKYIFFNLYSINYKITQVIMLWEIKTRHLITLTALIRFRVTNNKFKYTQHNQAVCCKILRKNINTISATVTANGKCNQLFYDLQQSKHKCKRKEKYNLDTCKKLIQTVTQ